MALAVTSNTESGAVLSKRIRHRAGRKVRGGQLIVQRKNSLLNFVTKIRFPQNKWRNCLDQHLEIPKWHIKQKSVCRCWEKSWCLLPGRRVMEVDSVKWMAGYIESGFPSFERSVIGLFGRPSRTCNVWKHLLPLTFRAPHITSNGEGGQLVWLRQQNMASWLSNLPFKAPVDVVWHEQQHTQLL